MTERPEFTHKRERHGVIGPFSGRQLVLAFAAVIVAGVVLVGITTPLGNTGERAGRRGPATDRLHPVVTAAGRAEGRRDRRPSSP